MTEADETPELGEVLVESSGDRRLAALFALAAPLGLGLAALYLTRAQYLQAGLCLIPTLVVLAVAADALVRRVELRERGASRRTLLGSLTIRYAELVGFELLLPRKGEALVRFEDKQGATLEAACAVTPSGRHALLALCNSVASSADGEDSHVSRKVGKGARCARKGLV